MDAARIDGFARRLAAPASRRQLLITLFGGLATLYGSASCASQTGQPGPANSNKENGGPRRIYLAPIATTEEEGLPREECVARGGTYQGWGQRQQQFCQFTAPDAGKSCTDGSQCSSGRCITFSGTSPGTCQRYTHEFGCQATLTNGKAGQMICIE